MTPTRRRIAWLAVLALLANLSAYASAGAAVTAGAGVGAERPDGPVLVICTPEGMKRLVWTGEGYVPLPEPGTTKPPCPLCGSLSAGALLPTPPAIPLRASLQAHEPPAPFVSARAVGRDWGPPPVRGPPHVVRFFFLHRRSEIGRVGPGRRRWRSPAARDPDGVHETCDSFWQAVSCSSWRP